ncbi:SGNH/GDSL hydrolase family protein [Curtobacterium sp. 1P10AnD]|uniref:SGNH/GDSL hydrolase family protein n=1 Tax=Curtobacterium sp. 1P10AnD TaxID=3132283 RepID=UPI0039A2F2F6
MRIHRAWSIVGVLAALAFALSLVTVQRATLLAADDGGSVQNARLAVVGDSLSAGTTKFLGNGLDDGTWIPSAVGDGVEFAGGWARSGATPQRMAENVRPVDDVDVLVILGGTNAVRLHKTLAEEASSYRRIVSVVRPREVLVAAIPPYAWQPSAAERYNRDLRLLAEAEGWSWGDPWSFARDGRRWKPGVSEDGTHPAGPEQYRSLGSSMRSLIDKVLSRTSGAVA